MKIEFDKKKSAEALSGVAQGAVELGKKAVAGTKSGIATVVERSKSNSLARRRKKYNPLFPEQYQSPDFHLPNMVMIVDDAVRRDIDVCEGAIGWLSNDSGIEILYLYDEFVEFSGLQFLPTATCDAAYYVDSFDRSRFIRTDCIFSKAHEERMAELKHIAYSLGAKRCSIEICEASISSQQQRRAFSATEQGVTEAVEQSVSQTGSDQRSGRIIIEFQGNDAATPPTLKWFAHDETILRLIEMRCNGTNAVKSEMLELAGSSSATMSQKTACAIDSAVGGQLSMNSQAAKEHRSKLLLHIEF